MTNALLYTRVSLDVAHGRSPAEQEVEARAVCEREGWTVLEVVTDSVGASRHSKGRRTGWERAKQLMRSGTVDVLVTWEASRAQRDLDAYTELRRICVATGVRWSYSGRTYDLSNGDDRFTTGIDALVAERASEDTSTRVLRAMRANAAQGRPHGRRLYGYERIYHEKTGALVTQRPHPDEAPVVRRIFASFVSGASIHAIACALHADGIPSPTGRPRWTWPAVRRVLTNKAYIARRIHRGVDVGGADWPALVTPDRFARAQARLEAQAASKERHAPKIRLLTGVARCGVCGSKLHSQSRDTSGPGTGRRVYICRESACVGRDARLLEAYVVAALLDRLARPDVDFGAEQSPAVTAARAEVAEIEQQLDDALAEFTAGRLTAAMLSKAEIRFAPRLKAANLVIRRAAVPIEIDIPDDNVGAWWDDLTPEQQRAVVGAFLLVTVNKSPKRGAGVFDPDAVVIEFRA